MTVCRNPDGEADYVMHKIEQLSETKRISDIGILLFLSGDVAEYASAFKRKDCNLKYSGILKIRKKKVSYHSGVEAVRSLSILHRWTILMRVFFRYLKSGMSDLMERRSRLSGKLCSLCRISEDFLCGKNHLSGA